KLSLEELINENGIDEEVLMLNWIEPRTRTEVNQTPSPKGDKDQGEVDSSTVTSRVSIPVSVPEKAHEALAGPDPEPMKEDQTRSDSVKLHVSLAGQTLRTDG
ncbi:hypothetical protein Tco_0593464, partial [Tanacetum coccineum]